MTIYINNLLVALEDAAYLRGQYQRSAASLRDEKVRGFGVCIEPLLMGGSKWDGALDPDAYCEVRSTLQSYVRDPMAQRATAPYTELVSRNLEDLARARQEWEVAKGPWDIFPGAVGLGTLIFTGDTYFRRLMESGGKQGTPSP